LVTQCSAKPQFCRKYDCPEYTVESKTDDYEVRCYRSYKWVTTTMSGNDRRANDRRQKTRMTLPRVFRKKDRTSGNKKPFKRLSGYIRRAKDWTEKIRKTVPVFRRKDKTSGNKNPFMRLFGYIQGANDKKEKISMTVPVLTKKDNTSSSTEMSFFIPFAHQANPPRPTASDVYIENMQPLCVYVRSFGGWMWLSGRSNYAALKNALRNDGLENSYSKNYYYTAGYDSPWKIRNRHNEIWFIKL